MSINEIETRIGTLSFTHDFENGYPTKETVEKIYNERDFQRACQLYLWAMPMVSIAEMVDVVYAANGASPGDVFVAETIPSLSYFLTPNATTPYNVFWFNLAKSGPYVIEWPAGPSAGFVDNLWQQPMSDMGLPGPDKGKGAKFLIVGPGQTVPAGSEDYIVVKSNTFNTWGLIRMLSTDAQERQAMQEKFRLYPFSQRANPPATKRFRPVVGKDKKMVNAPRGLEYWEKLSRWVNEEPVHDRDRIMMAMLRSIGIEKGKPFNPDARMKKILTDATLVGEAMAKVNDYEKRAIPQAHYAEGSEWMFELCLDPGQETEHYTQLDERASFYYEASGGAAAMVTKTPGVGSIYLGTNKDKEHNWLDGANTYQLHIPPNAPVTQFWAMTIYDVSTRTFIVNGEEKVEISSRQPDLAKNADGSLDVYVGPKAPAGFEKNWVRTVPGKAWFPYFRLYGPTEAHFDRTWVLPDFEKVK